MGPRCGEPFPSDRGPACGRIFDHMTYDEDHWGFASDEDGKNVKWYAWT